MTYGMLYKNQVAKEAGWAYQHSTPHWKLKPAPDRDAAGEAIQSTWE